MPYNIKAPTKIADKNDSSNMTILNNWKERTPAEAAQWVEDNVTDLASAKQFLKIVARLLIYLIRSV